MSEAEYENDRESLRRMLADFRSDYLAKHGVRRPRRFLPHPPCIRILSPLAYEVWVPNSFIAGYMMQHIQTSLDRVVY